MANDEERVLEGQLELQLQEQRDSLSAVNQALASDSTNSELLSVRIFYLFIYFLNQDLNFQKNVNLN